LTWQVNGSLVIEFLYNGHTNKLWHLQEQRKLLHNLNGISTKIDAGLNNLKIHKTKNVKKNNFCKILKEKIYSKDY
jgi:hypothetical protein